jgi:hypothetical protein
MCSCCCTPPRFLSIRRKRLLGLWSSGFVRVLRTVVGEMIRKAVVCTPFAVEVGLDEVVRAGDGSLRELGGLVVVGDVVGVLVVSGGVNFRSQFEVSYWRARYFPLYARR